MGIVETKESLAKARAVGMDLVEVDPHSRPPVCRIMNYGKWKYAQRKKESKSKSHRHETELKELRIKTPKIGDHDLSIKVTHAKDFLSRGDRVQFTLRMRGRELAHADEGRRIFEQIKKELADVAKVDQDTRFEGKRFTMTLAPLGMASPAGKKPGAQAGGKPAAPRPALAPKPAAAAPPQPAPSAPAAEATPAAPAAPPTPQAPSAPPPNGNPTA